jgi:Heterokaryon incompatibility protein (HET)
MISSLVSHVRAQCRRQQLRLLFESSLALSQGWDSELERALFHQHISLPAFNSTVPQRPSPRNPMRLLKINDDGAFSLTEHLADPPRYAILSHTWSNEEVLFRHLVNDNPKSYMSRAGWKKIEFCIKRALMDGLKYCWLDTCCIDRSNSVELSEAIKSMFRWFRNATKCYVILEDLSVPKAEFTSLRPAQSRALGIAEDLKLKWFTRAWTLQELLAPSSIDFFSREGELLGDKRSLELGLQEITGIPLSALRGTPLSQFSFRERFSWAKGRRSTVPEDLVYSLLGIFDVYISPIYGEGFQAALRRFREQVSKKFSYQFSDDDDDEIWREWVAMTGEQEQPGVTAFLTSVDNASTHVSDSDTSADATRFGTNKSQTHQQTLVARVIVDYATDSGYGGSIASKPEAHQKVLVGRSSSALAAISETETEYADHETIYSDTPSLDDPRMLEYVTVFADELFGSLPTGFDLAEFERVEPHFEEILQTFALKLRFDGDTPELRSLMYLVHRYRA